LSKHWNLGSRLNRYLQFDTGSAHPVMKVLSCPAKAGVRYPYSCTFMSWDDSSGVAYVVYWGDGSRTRVPRSGFVQPSTSQIGTHAYRYVRSYRLSVVAVDSGSPGLKSKAASAAVRVIRDVTPPAMTITDPAVGMFYKGCD